MTGRATQLLQARCVSEGADHTSNSMHTRVTGGQAKGVMTQSGHLLRYQHRKQLLAPISREPANSLSVFSDIHSEAVQFSATRQCHLLIVTDQRTRTTDCSW